VGIIQSNIHGRTGIIVLCEHAAGRVDAERFEPVRRAADLTVCEECFVRERLQGVEEIGIDEVVERNEPELNDAYDQAHRALGDRVEPRCASCVDWARIVEARHAGLPDPFAVYERTLFPVHEARLAELRELLLRRFDLREPSLEPVHPAVTVSAGSFRAPVTITVYGIFDEPTQDAVASLVESFFAGRERSEARLVFVKAMEVDELAARGPVMRRLQHRRDRERVLRRHDFT
jgi:hypothetical protein